LLIHPPASPTSKFVLFNLGLRPFFLLAGIYALITILIWIGVSVYGWPEPHLPFSTLNWHAHEMIFGYGMAVVAGFLLTAVTNWTGLVTLKGYPLAGLAALWLAARLAGWLMPSQILPMALLDLLFNVWFAVAIFIPVLRVKQYKQIGIAAKLVLMMLANLSFYLGASGMLEHGVLWGLYSGLYVMLALVFSMTRRVLPFFIERGVGYPVALKNRLWLDHASLYVFLMFLIADVFWQNVTASAVLAGLLFAIHLMRLAGWHTSGIWKKPLLWVLYLGYAGAVFGFLLKAIAPFVSLSPYLAIHAFALGGIGMITLGMMARISLAHTGRDINQQRMTPAFVLLLAAFIARVLLPIIVPNHYLLWLGIAQLAWLLAFAMFVRIYTPILIKPRADGMPG